MRWRRALPLVLLLLVLAVAEGASPVSAFRLGGPLEAVTGNPADGLSSLEPDDEAYDPASRCIATPRPGAVRLQRWLERHVRGVFWGAYRCERWGKGSASLHAEGRAIDWHLDVRDPADKAAARELIRLLLAPDRAGTPRALARRMGVEELIWDCSYWAAGMDEFVRYRPCYGKDGRTLRKRVDATVAHRDHVHIGLSKAGAAARTSFWTAGR